MFSVKNVEMLNEKIESNKFDKNLSNILKKKCATRYTPGKYLGQVNARKQCNTE